MTTFATVAGVIAGLGLLSTLAGWAVVLRFARRADATGPIPRPAVTVLKPLYGAEPLLEDALATVFTQAYPNFQIVFGVQDPADPALAVVERLRARFPDVPVDVVVDPTQHGRNRKVGNLMNMLPAARHEVLVISDSDVHVPSDWLARLVSALAQPGVGLATTLYTGLPVRGAMMQRLAAMQITYGLLPGALLSRLLGRRDCFGASMALRRETLTSLGGFRMLVDHLADDNVLGRLVRAEGLTVALAGVLPATTVAEERLPALWSHELRWARTTRALEPFGFAASSVQYPLFWAALAVLASGGAVWAIGLLLVAWTVRALAAHGINRTLGLAIAAPFWLFPLRDMLSVAVLAASFTGDRVEWRGHMLDADNGRDEPNLGGFDTEEEVILLR